MEQQSFAANVLAKSAGLPADAPDQRLEAEPPFLLDDLDGLEADDFYPESDGEPMAETDFQREPLTYAVSSLRLHFQERADVYVSGNLFIYYEQGDPTRVVAPDVFVVFGVPNYDRRIYKVWAEGKAPDVVIEVTSKKTRQDDEKKKPALYQQLGVKEYFQYDPTGDYLKPALKGRWLDENGEYQPMRLSRLPGGILSLYSYLLNVELHLEGDRLRLFDPDKAAYLLSHEEEQRARQEAERQAKLAKQQARDAEWQAKLAKQQARDAEWQTKLAEQRAKDAEQQVKLAEQRAKDAEQQAKLAEQRAKDAEQQASLERMSRQDAETRANDVQLQLERLNAELERLRAVPDQKPH
jgi:Uma2 family endonuclease